MPKPIILKRPVGAPRKLFATEETLNRIKASAAAQASDLQIAAILLVSHQTFITFKKANPVVQEMIDQGREYGKAAVRQALFTAATKGNVTAMIWFGKNYSGETDQIRAEVSGPNGSAIETQHTTRVMIDLEAMSDEELVALRPVLLQLGRTLEGSSEDRRDSAETIEGTRETET